MVNLVTIVGRNTHILPHMLKHYENMVDKVYVGVYKHSQDDPILEEVLELGIQPFMVRTAPPYNADYITEMYNAIIGTKPNDWWIVADSDELQVYPYGVDEIVEECEKSNYTFVTGGFLDRIGPNGTFPTVTRTTDIHKAFPLAGFFRYPMSDACPNKVVLCKGSQIVTSGQHYAKLSDTKSGNSWGRWHKNRMPVDDVFAQVHHFKWDSSAQQRIKEVSQTIEDYTWWWEYKRLYDQLEKSNWKVDVKNPEFKVESLKEFSYINYADYRQWNDLTDLIISI